MANQLTRETYASRREELLRHLGAARSEHARAALLAENGGSKKAVDQATALIEDTQAKLANLNAAWEQSERDRASSEAAEAQARREERGQRALAEFKQALEDADEVDKHLEAMIAAYRRVVEARTRAYDLVAGLVPPGPTGISRLSDVMRHAPEDYFFIGYLRRDIPDVDHMEAIASMRAFEGQTFRQVAESRFQLAIRTAKNEAPELEEAA